MSPSLDPYQVLGVWRGASDEEIRRAYLNLVKEYHPDRNQDPDAEEFFKEITWAYRNSAGQPTNRTTRYRHILTVQHHHRRAAFREEGIPRCRGDRDPGRNRDRNPELQLSSGCRWRPLQPRRSSPARAQARKQPRRPHR